MMLGVHLVHLIRAVKIRHPPYCLNTANATMFMSLRQEQRDKSMLWRRLASFIPLTIAFALVPVVTHAAFTTSITSDGTLPTPTSVSHAANVFNINGGTIRGSN